MIHRRLAGRAILVMLLLGALAPRLLPLWWGVPVDSFTSLYHPDEKKIMYGALAFPGDILARTDLRYPTLLHHAIGTLTWPVRAVASWADGGDATDLFVTQYVMGRLLSATLGALTVVLVYRIGRRAFGRRTALLAATLLTLAAAHILNSALATVDVALAFFVTLAFERAVAAADSDRRRADVACGIACGLAVGTKYVGAIAVAPAIAAQLLRQGRCVAPAGHRADRSTARRAACILAGFALLLAVTGVVFAASTPSAIFDPGRLSRSLSFEWDLQGTDATWSHLATRLSASRWRRVFSRHADALGFALTVTALAGVLRCSWRPRRFDLLALALVVPYYLLLFNKVSGRYILPTLAVICLMAARWMAELLSSPRAPVRLATAILIAATVLGSARHAAAALATRLAPDTRTLAARFVAENVPDGSAVCMGNVGEYQDEPWTMPPVSVERYRQVDCLETDPDVVILSGRTIDEMTEQLRSERLLPGYAWDPSDTDTWAPDLPPAPEVFAFYDDLLNRDGLAHGLVLRARFEPVTAAPIEFPAPEIRVYVRRR